MKLEGKRFKMEQELERISCDVVGVNKVRRSRNLIIPKSGSKIYPCGEGKDSREGVDHFIQREDLCQNHELETKAVSYSITLILHNQESQVQSSRCKHQLCGNFNNKTGRKINTSEYVLGNHGRVQRID